MLRLARWTMYVAIPAELLLTLVLLSGVPLPDSVLVVSGAAATAALLLTLTASGRVYAAARWARADRRTAARHTVREIVPAPARRVISFDVKGMQSLWLLCLRRRHGIPPDAVTVPYAREPMPVMFLWIFILTVDAVATEVVLRGIGAPPVLRRTLLVVDGYSILAAVAVAACWVTRPHVVTAHELRLRSGAFFDLRVPRHTVASVRLTRCFNEPSSIAVADDRLGVCMASQTNVVVELTEPVTYTRPLGRRGEARTIRFFTDTPEAAVAALRDGAEAGMPT
ncbi:hypothetical protein [Embleya hyalina]|uniref:Uncharacterized protein n=1 Tax=Embleya hyalina TaxID=516124 RepID=A0A401YEI4_9ACTN|nr:hypothetical protein [Embleya hyalina]GCD93011.1 hypothetical protein EHYA_00654 [Embleya hyalina]